MWKKMLVLFFVSMLIAPIALSAQSTTFLFRMSSDGTGLCIDKYTGDEQYVVIQASYDGLAVKEIAENAFSKTNVVSVTIPDCVEGIGRFAFYGCKNLTKVTLPENLKWINGEAFRFCGNLSSIDVRTKNAVNWRGYDHFNQCSNIPMSTQIKLIKLGYKGSF